MATGGTIPSGRRQFVTFYNTHGIIEKDKNLYFAPRFNNSYLGKTVSKAYSEMFDVVCPPSSAYKAIEVSGWSPQDRTLVVKGNIDDFRLITDEGACLNYFLIERQVTKGEGQSAVTKTYYYAFFITGVEQVGGSSVRITAEPDDFSNVFYWHNLHVLTSDNINFNYEPFNARMKNCHVNRQHYDRVSLAETYYELTLRIQAYDAIPEGTIQVGQPIELQFEDREQTVVFGTVLSVTQSVNDFDLIIKTEVESEIGEPEDYSRLVYNGVTYRFDYATQDILWDEVTPIEPANLKIFLNQEDSFKFKYQYRDDRRPFSFNNLFTKLEIESIKNTAQFSSLSESLRKKILNCCMQYLMLEMKSEEKFMPIKCYVNGDLYDTVNREFSNNIGNLQKACTNIFFPFFNVPDFLKKYETTINAFSFGWKLRNTTEQTIHTLQSADVMYRILNKNSLADFVFGAYVVNDVCMQESMISYDFVNSKIIFTCNQKAGYTKEKDLYIAFLSDNNPNHDATRSVEYNYTNISDWNNNIVSSAVSHTGVINALMLSDYNSRDFVIDLSDNDITDSYKLKNEFIDPVLEAEPYSFYSLSYLAYEMPFNKNRYYEDMKLKFTYYVSVNGCIKLSFIPTYKVEGNEYKYYNECLIFSIPSSLPMVSDSYASYYYQNQAQMKNQFAVNDYNKGFDLAQHIFVSGPSKVGGTAVTKGGYGALGETVTQWGQIASEALDIIQSNEVIEMNQKAKIADVGAKPDVVKQSGSDVFSDLMTTENRPFINHYKIDKKSYDSIAKFLERFGYQVNLFDSIHAMDRVGWNFVKLNSFDWNPDSQYDIMVEQEDSIRKIFLQGVTLLHNKTFLTSGHNYERILG